MNSASVLAFTCTICLTGMLSTSCRLPDVEATMDPAMTPSTMRGGGSSRESQRESETASTSFYDDGASEDSIGPLGASQRESGKARDSDPLTPASFVGFSRDETRFAYGAYSRGAGAYLFTIVDTETGSRVTDLSLQEPETILAAKRLLFEGEFMPLEPTKSHGPDSSLRFELGPDGLRVFMRDLEGRASRVEPSRRLADLAARLEDPSFHLAGFSPSGRLVAVRVTAEQGPILGEASTYQILARAGR